MYVYIMKDGPDRPPVRGRSRDVLARDQHPLHPSTPNFWGRPKLRKVCVWGGGGGGGGGNDMHVNVLRFST